ncbi:MAG: tryptophan--tRNA ligase [Firmicutes bacterium ML8_F2]|jgi:tryptophanyl-tRNA synthetase|nr:MAG: tryptophan--tRNA ligase [Firmicutes bacterium ML8_F2]
MKKRIFSGIQPTGSIHIGNYLGAVKNWVKLQNEYDSIFCVVDLHALTVPKACQQMPQKVLDSTAALLAADLNPEKCLIFVQSQVPEHAELAWLLNTITPVAELERMTQYKEKAKHFKKNINMGLFDYPVLMAADILLYQTDTVPVGEDQRQHVELARTVARKFNHQYGKVFTVPETLIYSEGARIMSLNDPSKKMSKSVPQGCISMDDSPAQIRQKIRKAVTDSGQEIKYSLQKPAIVNLINIYASFSGLSSNQVEKKYQGQGYALFKNDLAEVVVKGLAGFQNKKRALEKKPAFIKKVLNDGAKKARLLAQKTLKQVKQKMGLL